MGNELHVVTTGQQTVEAVTDIAGRIQEGIDFLHIREKTWCVAKIMRAVELLKGKGLPPEKIIINDRVDVAHVLQVGGVQLGGHSLDADSVKKAFPSLRVGCSVHSLEEGLAAEKKGADHLFYGHIFQTASKPGVPPRGLTGLEELTQHVTIPVIAIGGITPTNTEDVLTAGAQGVAVLSGILLADDPQAAIARYQQIITARR